MRQTAAEGVLRMPLECAVVGSEALWLAGWGIVVPPWAPGVEWRCYDNGEGDALVGEFPDGTGMRHYVENVNPRAAWDFLAAESAVMVERWLG
jgi:hypothetical protein